MCTVGFCGVRKIRAAPPVMSRSTPPPVMSCARASIPKGSVKARANAVTNKQTRGFFITKSPQRQITTHFRLLTQDRNAIPPDSCRASSGFLDVSRRFGERNSTKRRGETQRGCGDLLQIVDLQTDR